MTSIDCCFGCKNRSVGCHGACRVYQELRARRNAEIEERIAENDLYDIRKAALKRKRMDERNERRRKHE